MADTTNQRMMLDRLQQAYAALEKMEARLERSERARSEPLAVVGMACRFPGGASDPEALWRLLQSASDAIGEVPPDRWNHQALYDPDPDAPGKIANQRGGFLEDVTGFDRRFFQVTPREAQSLDPQHRLLLEVAWEALENAAIPVKALSGTRTGVFVGLSTFDYVALQLARGSYEQVDPYLVTGGFPCMAAGRIAYTLGLNGPALTIDTACSSSLVAVHLACRSLRARESELALVGGVNLMLSPELSISFSKARMLSPDGRCKTFDAAANGYVRGEGCGAVVLKRLSDAEAAGDRIIAVLRGSAVNHDGVSAGITVPSGPAQVAVIRQALADARVEPDQVGYLEAHGTGTALGDPIELEALDTVFGRQRAQELVVGAVKTNLGHTEAASGMAGLLKALQVVQRGVVPPNLHFQSPNPKVPWEKMALSVPTEARPWGIEGQPRIAGVSSFGASGTNAHVIVESYHRPSLAVAAARPAEARLLALSARTPEALRTLAGRFAERLAASPDLAVDDVCYSANVGRTHFEHRLCVIGTTLRELGTRLTSFARGESVPGVVVGTGVGTTRTAFLFTGQGAQFPGMGRELYETEPVFREAIDRCSAIVKDTLTRPLVELLFSTEVEGAAIHRTENAQPALFALEYATAMLLHHYGVRADAVLGHSVGEYVAACVAGVFSLEDGLRLIAVRGRLMGALPPGGAMASALGDAERVHAAIDAHRDTVSVAAYNGPNQVVISGQKEGVAAACATLAAEGIKTLPLTVSHAFHSPLMEPMLEAFAQVARTVAFAAPGLHLATNRSGALAGTELTEPRYWVDHIRQPVHFSAGIATLHDLGCDVFVELGPKPVLSAMGRRCLPSATATTWLTTGQATGQRAAFLTALAELYVRGATINWKAQGAGHTRHKLALPTYPFQREPYFLQLTRPQATAMVTDAAEQTPLLGHRQQLAASTEIRFESLLTAERPSFLAAHAIHGTAVVPASAYVELALSAATHALGREQVSAEQVEITQPLLLPPGAHRRCQTVLLPTTPGRLGFRIFSRDRDASADAEWTLHCEGQVTSQAAVNHDMLPAVRARCTTPVDTVSLYRTYWENGLQLGPAFQAVRELHTGHGESLGQVALAESVQTEAARYSFHPALLDACFQVAGPLFLHMLKEHNYLPVSLGALRLLRAADPIVHCHARFAAPPAGDPLPQHLSVDFTVFGTTGDVIAHIEGLRFRKTDRKSVLRSLQPQRDPGLYQFEWQVAEAAPTPQAMREATQFLIFADRTGIAEQLAQALGPDGCRLVFSDSRYSRDAAGRRFTIDPAEPSHFLRLLADVSTAPSERLSIIHLGSLDIDTPDDVAPVTGQRPGSRSVLHLVQALLRRGLRGKLWLVTRGAQAVGAAARVTDVFQSPLWGLGHTLRLEHPELSPVLVDLDPAAVSGRELADLIRRGTEEDRLALRTGQTWVPRLTRLAAAPAAGGALPVVAAATYLISGGLGSLGLRVAEWLAAQGARSLLLVGRTPPSGAAEPVLQRLRAAGVHVQCVAADLQETAAVARIFRLIAETLPPLRGIVHAAGVLDDTTLQNADWSSFERAFAPKVAGAWNLHQQSAALPLDFFVCFSSVAAVLGAPGQAPYAAANAFLDALMHFRRARGMCGLSINWGPWDGGGMAGQVSDRAQAEWHRQGLTLLAPESALHQLERLLATQVPQALVLEVSWPQYLSRRYRGTAPALFAIVAPPSRAAAAPTPAGLLRTQLETSALEERHALLAGRIRSLVAGVMALPDPAELGLRQPLMEAGLDSLMTLEVRSRLERELDVSLRSTLLIDYPTLEALARHLAEEVLPPNLFTAAHTAPAARAKPRPRVRARTSELADIPADLADDQVMTTLLAELEAIEEERR